MIQGSKPPPAVQNVGAEGGYAEGLPVGGLPLARLQESIDELVTIGKRILLHLEEMTGDNFEGDT